MRSKPSSQPAPAATNLPANDMDAGLRELADLAVRYPFRWFAQSKVARLCGFGEDVMTALAALGAPVVARKCNPHLLHQWLAENLDRIGKIRPEEL